MAQQQSATQRILKIAGGLAVLLVLGVAGLWWMGGLGGGEEGMRVETAEVERRDITQQVTAFGRVQPEREITISPDVPGEIVALPVEEGERVQRGQLLAKIEAKDYVAQTQQQARGRAAGAGQPARAQGRLGTGAPEIRAQEKALRERDDLAPGF